MKTHAIIVCAGSSKRLGTDKCLALIAGKPVLHHTLQPFQSSDMVDDIFLVASENNISEIKTVSRGFPKVKAVVLGGAERIDSVRVGIRAVNASPTDHLIIHNGANPLASQEEIESCIAAAIEFGAAAVGFPATDSLRKVRDGLVEENLPRQDVWQMQTPQCSRAELLTTALELDNHHHTDETSVLLAADVPVKMVQCSHRNRKITLPEDLEIASSIVSGTTATLGIGEDSHRFSGIGPLTLGGTKIPSAFGFDANSDGDVLLHALCNAIMSAVGGASLGTYADDMAKKGIKDSTKYVSHTLAEARKKGSRAKQATFSIEASRPRLEAHVKAMKKNIASLLNIPIERVGITVTSGEGLSEYGKGEGMHCFCLAVLERI